MYGVGVFGPGGRGGEEVQEFEFGELGVEVGGDFGDPKFGSWHLAFLISK